MENAAEMIPRLGITGLVSPLPGKLPSHLDFICLPLHQQHYNLLGFPGMGKICCYVDSKPFSCKVHQEMAEKALSVMWRHLEVLAGPLIVLSLVDTCLPQATREAIGMKLLTLQDEWNPGAMPIRRAATSHDLISSECALGEERHEVN